MDKKRIIFAIVFFAVTLALGYGLYRVFFAKETPTPTTPGVPRDEQQPSDLFPQAGEGIPVRPTTPEGGAGLPTSTGETPRPAGSSLTTPLSVRTLVEDTVVGVTVGSTGAQFYNETDGRFYRTRADGRIEPMSDEIFFNVDRVTWSPKKNESVIEYPDGANIYYNFDTKRQVTLPKHWENFSFSKTGDRIAAKSIGLSPENRWIVAAAPDGSNVTLVEALGQNSSKVTVDWSPNNQIIALSRTGEALGADREEVLFVGLNGENFQSMVVEGRGLKTQWSPRGDTLLYSVYSARNDFKPELWIVNAQGDSIGTGRKPLNLNTWADKCAFADGRFAYCAAPETLERGAGFAPALSDTTPDRLYKIDIETGIRNELLLSDGGHVIDTISVGNDGKTLFFTDKNQLGLFEVSL